MLPSLTDAALPPAGSPPPAFPRTPRAPVSPRPSRFARLVRGVAAALALGLAAVSAAPAAEYEPLTVHTATGAHEFRVEIAATVAERAKGLMYRRSMAPDVGMLFDFRIESPVQFWMKNTYISLDMIFIRENGAVARVAESTTPLSERIVPSGVPVRYVLEVVAGTAARIGLKPGDRVEHRLIRGR